jgi:hypothetical protein
MMELEFEGKAIRCLKNLMLDTQEVEQVQEVRIPDDMPDIGSIICAWGQCMLRGKDWRSDSVGVNGGVMAWVLYSPSDGSEPRVLGAWLPMQCKWNMASSGQEGTLRASWHLRDVDGRMLSARKIMVRANAAVQAEVWMPYDAVLYYPQNIPADIQILRQEKALRFYKEAGEKIFVVEEELHTPDMEKPICFNVQPVINEQAVVGGKAVFRGDTKIHMVYQGMDGMLHSHDQTAPFSQFSDLDRDYDKEAVVSVVPVVSNFETEQTESGVRVKASVVMQYVVSDQEQVQFVDDAYSPVRTVNCMFSTYDIPAEIDREEEIIDYCVNVPQGLGQMVDMTVNPVLGVGLRREGGMEGRIYGNLQFVYYDEAGNLMSETQSVEDIWHTADVDGTGINAVIKSVEQPRLEGIQASGQIRMDLTRRMAEKTKTVNGLEMGELQRPDPGRPSLVLRRAGGQSLWSLAKESGSTVEAIQKANGLSGEPMSDQMLLIPVV